MLFIIYYLQHAYMKTGKDVTNWDRQKECNKKYMELGFQNLDYKTYVR